MPFLVLGMCLQSFKRVQNHGKEKYVYGHVIRRGITILTDEEKKELPMDNGKKETLSV